MKWPKRTESPTYQIALPHPLTRAPIHGAFLPLKKIKNQKLKRKNQKDFTLLKENQKEEEKVHEASMLWVVSRTCM